MSPWLEKGFQLHAAQARRMAVLFAFVLPLSTSLLEICGALLAVHWAFSGDYREKWSLIRRTPAIWIMAALFGLFVVGSLWGPVPVDVAMKSALKQRKLLYGLPLLTLLAGQPDWRQRVIRGFQAGVLLTLILSYLHPLGLNPFHEDGTRWSGAPFKNYIAHSILMCFFVYTLILDWRKSPQRAWLILPLMGMAAFNVLGMTPSRTAYVLLPLLVVVGLVQTASRKQFAIGLTTLSLLLGSCFLAVPQLRERVTKIKTEYDQYMSGKMSKGRRSSVGLRLVFYKRSWELFRERPLVGWGTGGLATKFQEANTAGGFTRDRQNPHNLYLYHAVEHGLLGLTWLLTMFGVQFWTSRSLPAAEKFLARGALAWMLVGSLANSLLMDVTEGTLFVLFIGICWAAQPLAAAQPAAETDSDPQPQRLAA